MQHTSENTITIRLPEDPIERDARLRSLSVAENWFKETTLRTAFNRDNSLLYAKVQEFETKGDLGAVLFRNGQDSTLEECLVRMKPGQKTRASVEDVTSCVWGNPPVAWTICTNLREQVRTCPLSSRERVTRRKLTLFPR